MVGRPSSRDKIVAAAVKLAKEVGPGHISLDAVAQGAGVSKGGLLYHFPSKKKLLEAIVSYHLVRFEDSLHETTERKGGGLDSVISACVELYKAERMKQMPPAAGILAALVENPDLLLPAKACNRRLIDRVRSNASNEASALVIYLAIEGLRCLPLLGLDVLTEEERSLVVAELLNMVDRGRPIGV